uniref:RAS p21 protein activator 1 n=2 Tax=Pygocentrus nattereri TaxID=42514 RepID=A0AAR2KVA2_PYGNA
IMATEDGSEEPDSASVATRRGSKSDMDTFRFSVCPSMDLGLAPKVNISPGISHGTSSALTLFSVVGGQPKPGAITLATTGIASAGTMGNVLLEDASITLPSQKVGTDNQISTYPSPQVHSCAPFFPQPPSAIYGALGTIEENDALDGQEYEEEEVTFPRTASPPNQWYHGKLDRTIAEERLRQAQTPGSYLIRESGRRPGSFVLSFLSMTSTVNHFRIIAMCGDYYIGGRCFSSLSDLIGYYSYVSCLLKGEKLLSPVAPPEPVEDRRRVRAILPYTKTETDELSFLKGDLFIVHNEDEDGWMWVTNVRTDEQGLIVKGLVKDVGREEDPHEGKIWYHGKVTKQEAYTLLKTVGQVSSFLVRPSDSTPGDYTLFFRTNKNIQRFKICLTSSNNFMMGGRVYNSIDDIVEHYRKEQIVQGYVLEDAVPAQRQEQIVTDFAEGREIYKTLRQKTKDAFYKNIVKNGYLLFNKGKRWKNLYFILEGNDSQLIYFESEKRATKPKGLIDLSECSVYGVHDSMFSRPNCFQIVFQQLFSEELCIFYFAGETPEQAQDWMKCLQTFCSNLRKPSQSSPNKRLRQVRSLLLYVEEAHKLPSKHFTNAYCSIYLNSIQVAKTHPREGQNPVWTEEFIFDDLSDDIRRFEITLSNKTKKSKESDILFMRCQLCRLQKGQMIDEWFPLTSHVPLKGIEPSSLRVRARYSMEKIMPEEVYSEFKELILLKEFHVINALANICGQDRTFLASILLRIFRHERLEAQLLRSLNSREISMEDEATTLFRSTTLASTLMEQYMKATATPFVHHALKDTILKIMECKQSCELNPSKLERNEDVNVNLAHLLSLVSQLMEKIFMATENLPPTLRFIYGCLQKSVEEKWPRNTTMRTRVVSGFVFLRLICPAIVNPRIFNIIADPPSTTASRTLTLVAKAIQNLANLVEFGTKEPYMEGVNSFIKSNKNRMIMFLDELGNVPELPTTTEHFSTDLARDLAALHDLCVSHSDELRVLSNERGVQQHVLKKLLAITELLQQTQSQYAGPSIIR